MLSDLCKGDRHVSEGALGATPSRVRRWAQSAIRTSSDTRHRGRSGAILSLGDCRPVLLVPHKQRDADIVAVARRLQVWLFRIDEHYHPDILHDTSSPFAEPLESDGEESRLRLNRRDAYVEQIVRLAAP